MAEVFDIVNEEGVVIGSATRAECHGNPDLLHCVAHVLVFRTNGRLILQRRSLTKDLYPGLWDTSVGGHFLPGEQPVQAACREMAEELGIARAPLRFLYRYIWRGEHESELVFTYKAMYAGLLQPCPVEVAEAREWSSAEIESQLGSGLFTPSFEHEWSWYSRYAKQFPDRW